MRPETVYHERMDWLSLLDDYSTYDQILDERFAGMRLVRQALDLGAKKFPQTFEKALRATPQHNRSLRDVANEFRHPLDVFGITPEDVEPLLPFLDLDSSPFLDLSNSNSTTLLAAIALRPPTEESLNFLRWAGGTVNLHTLTTVFKEENYPLSVWNGERSRIPIGIGQWACDEGIPVDYLFTAYLAGYSQNQVETAWRAGTPIDYLLAGAA